jgi:hypothetical protein
MENKKFSKIKINSIRTIKPQKFNEKIKFYSNKQDIGTNFKNKNPKNKFPFQISKNQFQNKTFFEPEKENIPKINFMMKTKKINIFQPKLRQVNSELFRKIKKRKSSSQENIKANLNHKTLQELFNIKLEKEIKKEEKRIINEEMETNGEDINIDEFMEKIKKEFNDIGKIIKIKFVVDNERQYEFEKNEFVILKIIENDLKLNQGLDIKEFSLNDQILNVYKSLKENKIENNSIIKVII